MSVKRKLNIKSLGEKYQALKDFYKPVEKPNSTEVRNELETLQNLCLYHEKGNDVRDLLQRFKSLHILDVTIARKQSNILTFFGRI